MSRIHHDKAMLLSGIFSKDYEGGHTFTQQMLLGCMLGLLP